MNGLEHSNFSDSNNRDSLILTVHSSEEGTLTPKLLGFLKNDELLKSNKRPSLEAFCAGIQPFKPFENLPGSEGGYSRVLKTIRSIRLQQNNGFNLNSDSSA